jgi:DNA-binding transcriptional regulator YiaG
MQKFDEGGLRNVWLENGFELHRTPYGKAVSYHDLDGLTRTVCEAITRKPGRLTGAEFRYLRLHLALSQKSLGSLLGVSDQSVASWEKRGRIPLLADKHLRLLWQEKHDGNETIVRTMNRLNDVERLISQKIVVRASPTKGWIAKTETVA